jgi:hypothetical protein
MVDPARAAPRGSEVAIQEMQAEMAAVERKSELAKESCFGGRVEAVDRIEMKVIARIEGLLAAGDPGEELVALKRQAEGVVERLQAVNDSLLRKTRRSIRSGTCRGADLRSILQFYAGCSSGGGHQERAGYDGLDSLVNGLLLCGVVPEETRPLAPGMVYYQPTPARIILELVERASFQEGDVFYDLGSGLGQVVILVHLLSGVRAVGIEYEPAFCEYARQCACQLGASSAEFINADARHRNLRDGTVFFVYTSFEGVILQEVLGNLEGAAQDRRIRIYTYGPCTLEISQHRWLERVGPDDSNPYVLAEFRQINQGQSPSAGRRGVLVNSPGRRPEE